MSLNRVKEAIEAIKQGEMIVLIDDEDRENEGDLVYAGTFSTPQKVNFLATHAKGLICVALTKEIAKKLDLNLMVDKNSSLYETAFTISVDAKECHTGISAFERDLTIKKLSSPLTKPEELSRPGHIFPLIAKDGGVLARTGHTEGSVDLCILAGLYPSAVICEIMKEDGHMARRDDLKEFAKKHGLKITYISDIIEYRLKNEMLVSIQKEEDIEFFGSKVKKIIIKDHTNINHYAFVFGKLDSSALIKFHNIGSDIELFENSQKLEAILKSIEILKANGGALIFLGSKFSDTKEIKEFGIGAQIVKLLGISHIRLLTTHPKKEYIGLAGFGLDIIEEISV